MHLILQNNIQLYKKKSIETDPTKLADNYKNLALKWLLIINHSVINLQHPIIKPRDY